jgi:hypothetical protein
MRLKAYILAADPAWIEASVLSYYDVIEEIIVSYDENGKGWTGVPIAVEECLTRLKAVDRNGKFRYCPGHYARLEHAPMENETYQRQCALDQVGEDTDWVLQFDTDELLPNTSALLDILAYAERNDTFIVEWPMRVLYNRTLAGQYLQVCAANREDCFEYPAPIAVRPGVELVNARRAKGKFLRPVVKGDVHSLQITRSAEDDEYRAELLNGAEAALHNSWARSDASIRSKIASWGHNEGLKTWWYYYTRWRPAAYFWRYMHDLHPFSHGVWPALKPCETLPLRVTVP